MTLPQYAQFVFSSAIVSTMCGSCSGKAPRLFSGALAALGWARLIFSGLERSDGLLNILKCELKLIGGNLLR
jgi:hypothetical protein